MKFVSISTNLPLTKKAAAELIEGKISEVSQRKFSDKIDYVVQVTGANGERLIFNGQSAVYVTKDEFELIGELDAKVLLTAEGKIAGYVPKKAPVVAARVPAKAAPTSGSPGFGSNRFSGKN